MQRKKPNRKQRELRRKLNAEIFQEGFDVCYDALVRIIQESKSLTVEEKARVLKIITLEGNSDESRTY